MWTSSNIACCICSQRPAARSCAIGDPHQAIYGFRGADAGCFERFERDFANSRTFRLARNYRSTATIVKAADAAIGASEPAIAMREMQEPIGLHVAPNEWREAEFVATQIERLLGGHDLLAADRVRPRKGRTADPLGFADFAVLYRTDGQSAALRSAFDQAGIPYKKSSPAPILDQPAVRAALRILQTAAGSLVEAVAVAIERLRRDGTALDAATLAEAKHWLAALAQSVDSRFDAAALRELAALSTEADFWDRRADRVSLLTMHAAKGLEFPVVFIVGLEEGLAPFFWGENARLGEEAEAEERRLFYVAMTRAKERLFLSRAAQRSWRGDIRALPPSRFLQALPARTPGCSRLPRARPRRTTPI